MRLLTTDGTDFGFAAGTGHTEAIMEHLAVVPACAEGSLRGSIETLTVGGQTGALIVVAAAVAPNDLALLSGLRSRFAHATVVLFDPSSWDTAAPAGPLSAGTAVLRVTGAVPFPDAWNRAMHTSGRAMTGAGGRR